MATASTNPRVIFIGLAGPSCCGKTTYARHLIDHLRSPFHPIGLDDFYIRSVLIDHPILGRVHSEEEAETLDTSRLIRLLRRIRSDPKKSTRYHRSNVSIDSNTSFIVVIVEGFLLFALSDELTNLFDIRIFFDSEQNLCRLRRYRRQYQVPENIPNDQIDLPPKFQQWFDHLVWAKHLEQRNFQQSKSEKTFRLDQLNTTESIDCYIDQRLEEILTKYSI